MIQPGRSVAMRGRLVGMAVVVGLALVITPARAADVELVASETATIQPTGPRTGDSGKAYANIQGKGEGSNADPKFSSFALLDFAVPKPTAKEPARAATMTLTLTLTQSVARFTRDGKIRFYLADDSTTPLETLARPLRFDVKQTNGVGDQLRKLVAVGEGEFLKGGTGDADPYTLTLDDAARKTIDDRIQRGGTIRLVVVPESGHVAATFFGVGAREAANRPRLTIKTAPAANP